MESAKYLRVLKMAQIPMEMASIMCNALSEETLNRITKVGFDRRYIYISGYRVGGSYARRSM